MSTPPVPREIVDFIIDCAWELYFESTIGRANPGAHRSVNGAPFNVLALVSRSWVARSRHCAFQDLAFRRKWSPDARQFTGTLLEHPLCTIREYVLRLHFGGDDSENGPVYIHDIADISYLRTFPNLKSLHLYDLLNVAQLGDSSLLETLLPTTLENLELESCTFSNPALLLDLIASATDLRSLKCAELFCYNSAPSTSVHSSPQHLTKLSVTVALDACRQILEWISSTPVPPRIANLELQISPGSVAAVSSALHVLGPSIVTLSLQSMTISDSNQSPFATVDVSTLPNLRHLIIACSSSPQGRMGIDVPLILARLAETCQTVQNITFRIRHVTAKEDIFTMPWEAIVAALNGQPFRQLVHIAIHLPSWLDEWPDARWDLLNERIGQQLLGNVSLVCRLDSDWS
ncbi:hypothetical protein EXIGLDRAFT_844039 [Exidia glandulosa HHB12029]|uniref:F-box domain-containing protein n=1 Tax=Exidia glandulosa HHB12029 TaxID=1314781 RepID=A0A165ZF39_EXIGL|nr:hypothetical protein EXIGLDRAFT_844039 [Exidia glandulosa HHB12029]